MSLPKLLALLALCVALMLLPCQPDRLFAQETYVPVGLGGGGAMYGPASSPHDPNLMFVMCDMGGVYRSEDGGQHWTMIDFHIIRSSTDCRIVFHPRDPKVIYLAGMVSRDAGKTWAPITQNPPWKGRVTQMGIGGDGTVLLAAEGDQAFISRDAGATWSACEGTKGKVVAFHVDLVYIFIATSDAIYRSSDQGKTWAEKSNGLPWRDIRSFAGGLNPGEPPGARVISFRPIESRLYCAVPSKKEGDKFAGGVYVSKDLGDTWQPVGGEGLNERLGKVDEYGAGDIAQYHLLGTSDADPSTVYVTCYGTGYFPPNLSTVYRSDDGGATWRAVYFPDLRYKECNCELGWIPFGLCFRWGGLHSRTGFSVNPQHPDVAMICDSGELYVTTDGGKSWKQRYSAFAPGQQPPAPEPEYRTGRWGSIGLEVTTTWNYDIDPNDHKRHYICYTDIGLATSDDGGKTWSHSMKGAPWENTVYQLAFDPARKGRVWAAMSSVHDIPHWTYVHDSVKGPGGACVSDDSGATWKPSNAGLPDAPCTSIIMDPKSPAGNRTLYATVYNYGVFKSTDDGKTWKGCSEGIDLARNGHTWNVQMHADGTLYCGVTGMRLGGGGGLKFGANGGLYRSADGGAHWEELTKTLNVRWPVGFAVDPRDRNVIYIAAGTIPNGPEGGIYKTTDGGKTWTRLLKDEDFAAANKPSYVHGIMVTIDPANPDTAYLGTEGHGMWVTRDAGKTWKQFRGVPFANIHRVTFDPDEANLVYITTFGAGVWRGPRP